MRYYELSDNMMIPGRWHLSAIRAADGSEPRLRVGIRCSCETLRAEVSHPGVELDFCLSSFAVPVVKEALAAEFERVGNGDVQRIPLCISGHDGFEVVNVLRVMDCLDESRAEFIKWTKNDHRSDLAGQYRQVTKLRVLRDAIPSDAHVFRIEGWLVGLVVSEAAKRAMEEKGCTGAQFIDVT